MYPMFVQGTMLALTLVLLLTQAAAPQVPTAPPPPAAAFRPGMLTPAVASRANPAQRYAVYLPSTFDGRTPMPVLFVLDYRGRARVGANVFVAAAERFGWIVVSSANSSSDEAPLGTLVALQSMWTDAHDLFPIDDRRIYLAGLSGTARTATWVGAQLSQTFTGIIGAAAGFAPETPPSTATRFLYFGTVGDVDYNYWEMRTLAEQLTALGRPHRIEEFSGSHGWMPPVLAMSAIEWMELRAMQAGVREVSASFVEVKWARDLQTAATLEEVGRPLAASRRLDAMAGDYAGLRPPDDIAAVRTRAARLAAAPAITLEAARRDADAAAHAAKITAAMRTLAEAFPVGAEVPAQPFAKTLMALHIPELLTTAAGRDQPAVLAARRLLAELEVQTGFYLPAQAMRVNQDARATYYLDLARAIDPDDGFAWFLRAAIHGRAKRSRDAIEALRRAVQLGFRSLNLIEQDRAFDDLRELDDFQQLVAQVRIGWEQERGR